MVIGVMVNCAGGAWNLLFFKNEESRKITTICFYSFKRKVLTFYLYLDIPFCLSHINWN